MASVAIDNVRLYREAQEQIAETKRAQEMLERGKESMQLAQQYVGIGIWSGTSRPASWPVGWDPTPA